MVAERDYLKFYDDETYLFEDVGLRFRETGQISAPDFYTALAWKANRAKNYHRDRLKALTGSFEAAVAIIAEQLHRADSAKGRLRILLIGGWGFYLPTASALLTIFWPDEYTVYDYRVAEELRLTKDLSQRQFSDKLWTEYLDFIDRVKANTPADLSLRNKDRWLTGKSYREEIERDCRS